MSLAPDLPPAPKLARRTLKAGKSDSVASVAARYKISAIQVAQWNKVGEKSSFKPGQAVVGYLAATKAVAKASVKTAGKSVAKTRSKAANKTAVRKSNPTVAAAASVTRR
ncbi:MAG: LysM peptidoglycan-binding domain-containing protein [Burkholderiaceae bacterium]|nr:LysM peptidoglycan-binding domain-containing protein [Burkholderiaceae bacterium]